MSKNDIIIDDNIQKLVRTFYGKVLKDERLGYIFSDFVEVDWN